MDDGTSEGADFVPGQAWGILEGQDRDIVPEDIVMVLPQQDGIRRPRAPVHDVLIFSLIAVAPEQHTITIHTVGI